MNRIAGLLVFILGAYGQTLEVPLTLEETAGVARASEPVTAGIPFPKGSLNDVTRLRLRGPDGKPVAASFRAVNRWWSEGAGGDDSIQWVHVDFFADVAANSRAVYLVGMSQVEPPPPPAALRVEAEGDEIRVDTGPLAFTAYRTGRLLNAPGLREVDFLLRSDERMYKISNWPASTLEVEEQNPLRVVLKRTGSHGWVNEQDKALDYVVRIVAWAGRPYIHIVHSFINRQGREMSDFVRLDGLWLQGQLERPAPPMRVDQLAADPRRIGWFEAGDVSVGLKWFWQLYPKGFEVNTGGRLRLALVPETARPQNIYTGVAKTHEMLLSFGGENLSAQLDHPLYAVAPPKWYTRDTKALGRLVESSPDAIRPQYWPLIQRYDRWLVASRDAVLAKRDRGVRFGDRVFDEYGMLDFGDAIHKIIPDDNRRDYGVHWETQYYDFPHSLFLHFFRTGDMTSFRTAIEAAAHLADVDISHQEVNMPHPGAARTGPGLNHWTRYSTGEFISSTSWAFYKNESLFYRYLLTGDLWSRDVARMSADWGVHYNGLDLQSNTRSIGHGLFAMLKAYEVFGDRKYLDRANWIIDCVHLWQDGEAEKLRELNSRAVWDPQFAGGYSHQAWMYGIALEAMAQASEYLRRPEMPGYMKRAADWLFANPKERLGTIMLTPGFAYIAETSGSDKYWDVAYGNFERHTTEGLATDRLKLFAQLYRNSQRLIWYLSVESPIEWLAPPGRETARR